VPSTSLPHTKKEKGVLRQSEETLAITGKAAVRGPVKIYCHWSATLYPPCPELNCPKEKFSHVRGIFTAGQGTAINFAKILTCLCNCLLLVQEMWMLGYQLTESLPHLIKLKMISNSAI
jgi:hypothetical protein